MGKLFSKPAAEPAWTSSLKIGEPNTNATVSTTNKKPKKSTNVPALTAQQKRINRENEKKAKSKTVRDKLKAEDNAAWEAVGNSLTTFTAALKSQDVANQQASVFLRYKALLREIYDQYDGDRDNLLTTEQVKSVAIQMGFTDAKATEETKRWFLVTSADGGIDRSTFYEFFLTSNLGNPGDTTFLNETFLTKVQEVFGLTQKSRTVQNRCAVPGHVKLMRQTSNEFRKLHSVCDICQADPQALGSELYILNGAPHKPEQAPNPLAPPKLVRQTSGEFVRQIACAGCHHSFCASCIVKSAQDQFAEFTSSKTDEMPACPVCEVSFSVKDLRNLLDETRVVKTLAVVHRESKMGNVAEECTCRACLMEGKNTPVKPPGKQVVQQMVKAIVQGAVNGTDLLDVLKNTELQYLTQKCKKHPEEPVCVSCGHSAHAQTDLMDRCEYSKYTLLRVMLQAIFAIDKKKLTVTGSDKLRVLEVISVAETVGKSTNYSRTQAMSKKHTQAIMEKDVASKKEAAAKAAVLNLFAAKFPSILPATDKVQIELYALLKFSHLNAVLVNHLRNTGLLSILTSPEHLQLYAALLKICRVLASNATTCSILRPDGLDMADNVLPEETTAHKSVIPYLKEINRNLATYLQGIDDSKSEAPEEAAILAFCENAVLITDLVLSSVKTINRNHKKTTHLLSSALSHGGEEGVESKIEHKSDDLLRKQVAAFQDQQKFSTVNLLNNNKVTHVFKSLYSSQSNNNQKRLFRIRKEMTSLASNLGMGLFVRLDEKRFDVLRCCIVGAEGTPYQNGAFLFDMYLPAQYPQVPPKCKIITTGKGRFRFNANLYSGGKVCLSILGTWSGPGWNPELSSILQVLISIQAMVMNEDPIVNEPSWGKLKGSDKALGYYSKLRHGTMQYAMLDHLTEMPYGFEDVLQAHFWLKKDEIKAQAEEWRAANYKQTGSSIAYGSEVHIANTIDVTVDRLIAKLDALEPPNIDDTDSDSDSDSD